MTDLVNAPPHYRHGAVECIEIARHLPGPLFAAVKYLYRSGRKDDAIQDCEKALWYLRDAEKNLSLLPLPNPETVDERRATLEIWQAGEKRAYIRLAVGNIILADIGRLGQPEIRTRQLLSAAYTLVEGEVARLG